MDIYYKIADEIDYLLHKHEENIWLFIVIIWVMLVIG